jgi:hypothetical protein
LKIQMVDGFTSLRLSINASRNGPRVSSASVARDEAARAYFASQARDFEMAARTNQNSDAAGQTWEPGQYGAQPVSDGDLNRQTIGERDAAFAVVWDEIADGWLFPKRRPRAAMGCQTMPIDAP